jgi:hypothetical protein
VTPCHTQSDIAGIVKAAVPVRQASPDPLAAFLDALDGLVECAQEDAVSACEALPNGRGMRGPDTARVDGYYAAVVVELTKLLRPAKTSAQEVRVEPTNWMVVHNPSARVAKSEEVPQ